MANKYTRFCLPEIKICKHFSKYETPISWEWNTRPLYEMFTTETCELIELSLACRFETW